MLVEQGCQFPFADCTTEKQLPGDHGLHSVSLTALELYVSCDWCSARIGVLDIWAEEVARGR